jgi:hypothetical protein
VKIVKPEIAMASLVVKVNKAMDIGMIRPPPPTPPTLAKAIRIVITIMPMNSE